LNDSISPYGGKEYPLDLVTKIIVISASLAITFIYFIIYIILYKKFKTKEKRILLNNISIINFVVLIFVQLFVGVIVKKITYEVDIVVLIGSQIIVTTIELLISNYLVSIFYFASKKVFKNVSTTSNNVPKNTKKVVLIKRIKR
jgi:hypothetical protein